MDASISLALYHASRYDQPAIDIAKQLVNAGAEQIS
jgi:hypothetical protein